MLTGSRNVISFLIFLAAAGATTGAAFGQLPLAAVIGVGVVGLLFSASPRMVKDWERGVLLRGLIAGLHGLE